MIINRHRLNRSENSEIESVYTHPPSHSISLTLSTSAIDSFFSGIHIEILFVSFSFFTDQYPSSITRILRIHKGITNQSLF